MIDKLIPKTVIENGLAFSRVPTLKEVIEKINELVDESNKRKIVQGSGENMARPGTGGNYPYPTGQ